jgi:hypothetical protein
MVPVLCLSPVQLSLPRSFSSLLSWHLSFIFYILSAGMAIQHEWRYWCILQYLTKQELGVACTSEERAVPLFSTGPLNISPRLTTNHLTLTDNPLFDFIKSYMSPLRSKWPMTQRVAFRVPRRRNSALSFPGRHQPAWAQSSWHPCTCCFKMISGAVAILEHGVCSARGVFVDTHSACTIRSRA